MNNQNDRTTFTIFVSDEKERLDKFRAWCFKYRPDVEGLTAYQWRNEYNQWINPPVQDALKTLVDENVKAKEDDDQ